MHFWKWAVVTKLGWKWLWDLHSSWCIGPFCERSWRHDAYFAWIVLLSIHLFITYIIHYQFIDICYAFIRFPLCVWLVDNGFDTACLPHSRTGELTAWNAISPGFNTPRTSTAVCLAWVLRAVFIYLVWLSCWGLMLCNFWIYCKSDRLAGSKRCKCICRCCSSCRTWGILSPTSECRESAQFC